MSELVKRLLQKNQTTLLRTVAEITQAVVAERSGLSPTLVSRLLSGKDRDDDQGGAVERVLAILAACNLVVTPRTSKAVDPDEYRALQVLAQKRLQEVCPSEWGDL